MRHQLLEHRQKALYGGDPRPVNGGDPRSAERPALALDVAARLEVDQVLMQLGSSPAGLPSGEAAQRLATWGPNILDGHGVSAMVVLGRQLQNPLLLLLAVAAIISLGVGDRTDATIILLISALSVGLSLFNEYRSERAAEELHARIRHRALTLRDGAVHQEDVTALVPGDVVLLEVGDIVPADLRLLEATALECDEAVVTGESMPVTKSPAPAPPTDSPLDLPSCALMGTVVKAGRGRGVVVRTGHDSTFGRIAAQLARKPSETAFQAGLRQYSLLLVKVTAVLTVAILVLNWLLGHPVLDSALFALAIAVGMTPQLLPAVVTLSLSFGARRLAARAVLVKRLVSIEDLGNMTVLFTDKTGTLTEGSICFLGAADAAGQPSEHVFRLGLLCNAAQLDERGLPQGNPLDVALWQAAEANAALVQGVRRLAETPFDFDRQRMSVVLAEQGRRYVVTKGAPEAVFATCQCVPQAARDWLEQQFDAGLRVVAVASRALMPLDPGAHPLPPLDPDAPDVPSRELDTSLQERDTPFPRHAASDLPSDDTDLVLDGFLVFTDPVKADARQSLQRLKALGIEVKIITGDNDRVARRLCAAVGLPVTGVLTGTALESMDDATLAQALAGTTVFSRVTPEHKSRVIRLQRALGADVGFLGDGVNDAVALHDADVGISVDSATDVAKDAADIVLLDKDLGMLGDGVLEGRQIFANTIKYVLMGTSSSFGNMFSAAGASLFLPFLPMTATQILLTNLLYYISQMTIPTDRVDEELVQRPAHWDVGFIRRFMILFGPLSSIFDFLTFGVMLWVFQAQARLFQSGWFVESLATQTLVIFVIRTRRVPFLRSRPGTALALASIACVAVGTVLPFSPLAGLFKFTPLPPLYFLVVGAMVAVYLALAEAGKALFYRLASPAEPLSVSVPLDARSRRAHRIITRWWPHQPRLPVRPDGRRPPEPLPPSPTR